MWGTILCGEAKGVGIAPFRHQTSPGASALGRQGELRGMLSHPPARMGDDDECLPFVLLREADYTAVRATLSWFAAMHASYALYCQHHEERIERETFNGEEPLPDPTNPRRMATPWEIEGIVAEAQRRRRVDGLPPLMEDPQDKTRLVDPDRPEEPVAPLTLMDMPDDLLPTVAKRLMGDSLVDMGLGNFCLTCKAFYTAAKQLPTQQIVEYTGKYVGGGRPPDKHIPDDASNAEKERIRKEKAAVDAEWERSICSITVSHVQGQLRPKVEAYFKISRVSEEDELHYSQYPEALWAIEWSQELDPRDVAQQFYKPTGWKHAARYNEWLLKRPHLIGTDDEMPPYHMTLDPVRAVGDAQREADFQAVMLKKKTPLCVRVHREGGTDREGSPAPAYMGDLTSLMRPNAHCHVMNSLDGDTFTPPKSRKNRLAQQEPVKRAFFIEDLEFGVGGWGTRSMKENPMFGQAVYDMGLLINTNDSNDDSGLQLIWRMDPQVRKLGGYRADDAAFVKKLITPPPEPLKRKGRGWEVVSEDSGSGSDTESDSESDDDLNPNGDLRLRKSRPRAAKNVGEERRKHCEAEQQLPNHHDTSGAEHLLPAYNSPPSQQAGAWRDPIAVNGDEESSDEEGSDEEGSDEEGSDEEGTYFSANSEAEGSEEDAESGEEDAESECSEPPDHDTDFAMLQPLMWTDSDDDLEELFATESKMVGESSEAATEPATSAVGPVSRWTDSDDDAELDELIASASRPTEAAAPAEVPGCAYWAGGSTFCLPPGSKRVRRSME